MGKIFLIRTCILYLCLILINSIDLFSQEMPQKKSALYWADLGWGVSSNKSSTKDIGFNLQNGNMLYTLQISKIDSSVSFLGTPKMEKSFIAIAVLLGVATRDTSWHASVSGGVTYLRRTITTNLFAHTGDPFDFFPAKIGEVKDVASAVGVTILAQLFFNKGGGIFRNCGKHLGMGIELFITANKLETIIGFTLNVMFGKLR